MFTLHRPIDRLREDHTPLVAARRRASVLAILGCAFLLTAVAAVLAGQQAATQITLVSPGAGASDVAAAPPAGPAAVIGAWCVTAVHGDLRYQVRFDDGSTAQRSMVPSGSVVTVDHDGASGLPFPGTRLEFAERPDGSWSCRSTPAAPIGRHP